MTMRYWCPLGCGKSVINLGYSKNSFYECLRCHAEFETKKDVTQAWDELTQ